MKQPRSLQLDYETGEKPRAIVFGEAGYLELEMAEPSPFMQSASRIWRRVKLASKATVAAAAIGFYPLMMMQGHQINDAPVSLDHGLPWAAPEAGVAVTLIAREVHGAGWAEDRDAWHPQARLTAMPAWQVGMANALSEHTAVSATLAEAAGAPDSDLEAAARLLRVENGLYSAPRLTAAAEALARYDGRASRGLAVSVKGGAALATELRLFADWADRSKGALNAKIGAADRWPASEADIEAFYTARARAHVAHELLNASARAESKLMSDAALRAEVRKTQALWRRAATQKPFFINNRNGDTLGIGNHLAGMAYMMEDAAEASRALAERLETPSQALYLAQANTPVSPTLP